MSNKIVIEISSCVTKGFENYDYDYSIMVNGKFHAGGVAKTEEEVLKHVRHYIQAYVKGRDKT